MKNGFIYTLTIIIGIYYSFSLAGCGEIKNKMDPEIKPDNNKSLISILKKYNIDFNDMPISFIANKGQVNDKVNFYARGPRYTLWLTREGMVFDTAQRSGEIGLDLEKNEKAIVCNRNVSNLIFVNSNPNPEIIPNKESNNLVNYLIGTDQSKWRSNIPTSKEVLYKNLYQNIDLKIYGVEKQIEYDWIIKPGADPGVINFAFKGIKRTMIDEEGNLLIETGAGKLIHNRPVTYQEIDGEKVTVLAEFTKKRGNVYGFSVGEYNEAYTLFIDPVVLLYSTYLGGDSLDSAMGIAVEDSEIVYIAGETFSTNFPTSNQYQAYQDSGDVFIAKIDTSQSGVDSLIYSTYLGGGGRDTPADLAVDTNGNVYLTGITYSTDFPTKNQFQVYPGGYYNAFVTQIDTTLSGSSSLVYSTYLGGGNDEAGNGIALDNSGIVHVAGGTYSTNFPTTNNRYQTDQGIGDAFVAQIDTTQIGSASLVYSTYFGGDLADSADAITVDSNGFAYVAGFTESTDFPTKNQYQTDQVFRDVFIAKVDTTKIGDEFLIYSTYLGGSGVEHLADIAVDASGVVYLAGNTFSTDFPTINHYQTYQGSGDSFIAKIDTSQSGVDSLVYSTYLGGGQSDSILGISIDGQGSVYATGRTSSTDFPTKNQYQMSQDGNNAFVSQLDTTRSGPASLIYSTYLGGGDDEIGADIAVDNGGNVYVIGKTDSIDFPTENPFQTAQGGGDIFISKLFLLETEEWQLNLENSQGSCGLTLINNKDRNVTANGNWMYSYQGSDISGTYVDASVDIQLSTISIIASGTASNPSAPIGYQLSPFTLSIMGSVLNGAGSGTYTISFQAVGWPSDITGNWKGTRTDGTGITPEICDIGYCEDFNSEPIDFTENPYFSVSDGRLHFIGDPALTTAASVTWNGGSNPGGNFPSPENSNYFENAIVSIDTFWEGRSTDWSYGLLLCGQDVTDSTSCLGHRVNGTGEYSISYSRPSGKGFLVDDSFSSLVYPDGQNNKLSVKKVGPYYYYYINGVEVQRRIINDVYGGSVGLYAFHPVDAGFDNFSVSKINYYLFEDDENNVDEDFETSVGGFWEAPWFQVSNGQFNFQGDRSDFIIFNGWNGGFDPGGLSPAIENSNYFENFTVAVDVQWKGGSDFDPYGLFVCSQNSIDLLNSVLFYISADGWYVIGKTNNGVWETLVPWTFSSAIALGGSINKLKIQKNGSQFQFILDKASPESPLILATLTIGGYEGGGIGLVTSEQVDVSFDNFSIERSGVPPIANAGGDQDVFESALVTLDGSSSTDDTAVVSYRWYQLAGPQVTISDSSVARPTFNAPDVENPRVTLAFQLKVTDDDRLHHSDITLVEVACAVDGDVNGDCIVDLKDAIVPLQVLSGMDTPNVRSDYVSSGVDINGDNKIGPEEAVNALRESAGYN